MFYVQKSYFAYLDQLAEGRTDKISGQTASPSTVAAADMSADAANLFYVDNAGGDVQEKTSKSKKKHANKKKKRANKSSEASPAKRSRALGS